MQILFARTALLDLPGHRGAVRYLRVWDTWSKLLQILTLWVAASFASLMVLHTIFEIPYENIILLLVVVAALIYAVLSTYDLLTPQGIGGVCSTLGMLGGAAYYFYYDKTGDFQAMSMLFRIVTGLGIGLLAAVGVLLLIVVAALVEVVCTCVNWLPAFVARTIFNLCFPAWKGVAHIGPRGYESLNPAYLREPRSFVFDKKLRRNGQAAKMGLPVFTWQELHTPGHIDRSLQQWIDTPQHDATGALAGAALGAGGMAMMGGEELKNLFDINPATGLPMVDGIGSLDVAGNHYGFNDADAGGMHMHATHET